MSRGGVTSKLLAGVNSLDSLESNFFTMLVSAIASSGKSEPFPLHSVEHHRDPVQRFKAVRLHDNLVYGHVFS